jgi:hypothetical protein
MNRNRLTIRTLRAPLLFEAATFATASLIHFGAVLDGYDHRKAGTAEAVIAAVLVAGSVLSLGGPARARTVIVAAQAFALLGVLVGLFTIAVGVGPRTGLDIAYHAFILCLLAGVLALAVRGARTGANP